MRRIAIYGKGGIGKSTISSNVTAALSDMGFKVLQIGCDPKSDSTSLLTGNSKHQTVLGAVKRCRNVGMDDIVSVGYGGSYCVECGGPSPGTGCAGRGVITAFETLEKVGAIEKCNPDVIIYDILGDVVCGGFAMPMRNGYANDIFIVTSGELMALYAANNIATAIKNFSGIGYARLDGLIQNSRNVTNEDELVSNAATDIGTSVIARIKRSPIVQDCEAVHKTVIEGAPESEQASAYRMLAKLILERSRDTVGGMKL
ncbi:MAG: nitrogenase iron protein NifH [archaeon]|nr:nitrogenase iron protein NifH [archaeon]